jgi:hypothetical protein
MAQKTVVALVDDLDGSDATQTVTFGIDGETYEIDLSDTNATALRNALRPYVSAGRRAGAQRPTPRQSVHIPSTGSSRNAQIRAWAARNGYTVPARGRISQAVVTAYDAAN